MAPDRGETLGPALRLGSGKTFGTVHVDARAMLWFSRFLAGRDPDAGDETAITRDAIEAYLVWVTASNLAPHTSSTYITCLRGFLDTCRRHGWLPGLPVTAALYHDDLPSRPRPLPRFIPEFVMHQLEDPERLAALPDATTRALVVVITETGLRANDACSLPFNPVIDDSAGWPCLRYFNAKMAAEQLVPLSARRRPPIRAQQDHLPRDLAGRAAVAVPGTAANPDGTRPTARHPRRPAPPAGRTTSTCATRPAGRCASPPTSSATPSGPGSSTRVCPSTSSRSCSVIMRVKLSSVNISSSQEACSSRRVRRPSKIFWRPTWPLAAASSRWRCEGGAELDGGLEEGAGLADRLEVAVEPDGSGAVAVAEHPLVHLGAEFAHLGALGVGGQFPWRVVEGFDLLGRPRSTRRRRCGWRCGHTPWSSASIDVREVRLSPRATCPG